MSGRNVKHNYIKSTNLRYWFFVIILLRPCHYLYFSGNSYPKCSDPQWTFLQTNISIIVPMEILQANDTLYTIHPVPLMPRWVNKWKFTLWFNIFCEIMNEYGSEILTFYWDSSAGELRLSQLSCTCFVYKYKWPDWFLATCCF